MNTNHCECIFLRYHRYNFVVGSSKRVRFPLSPFHSLLCYPGIFSASLGRKKSNGFGVGLLRLVVTRRGAERAIRYRRGRLDKAIKRETIAEPPWGIIRAAFPPASNEPSVHKCFYSVAAGTRPPKRNPGVLGSRGTLTARVSWSICARSRSMDDLASKRFQRSMARC